MPVPNMYLICTGLNLCIPAHNHALLERGKSKTVFPTVLNRNGTRYLHGNTLILSPYWCGLFSQQILIWFQSDTECTDMHVYLISALVSFNILFKTCFCYPEHFQHVLALVAHIISLFWCKFEWCLPGLLVKHTSLLQWVYCLYLLDQTALI